MCHLNCADAAARLRWFATGMAAAMLAAACESGGAADLIKADAAATPPKAVTTYEPWQHSPCPGFRSDHAELLPEPAELSRTRREACDSDFWYSTCEQQIHSIRTFEYEKCERGRRYFANKCIPCTICRCVPGVRNALLP